MKADGTWVADCCGKTDTVICEGPQMTGTQGPCDPGQFFGPDNNCYALNTDQLTWNQARTACQGRGTGWDLAAPVSAQVNTFVQSQVYGANDVWIGVLQNPDLSWSRVDGTKIWTTPVGTCRTGETARLAEDSTTHCYVSKTTPEQWSDMQKGGRTYSCGTGTCAIPPGCQDLGTGFDLVEIDSAAEDAFVQSMSGGKDVWTGGNEKSSPGTWRWPSNTTFWQDAAGCY
jgi:hypothetical protein